MSPPNILKGGGTDKTTSTTRSVWECGSVGRGGGGVILNHRLPLLSGQVIDDDGEKLAAR